MALTAREEMFDGRGVSRIADIAAWIDKRVAA
jgi:hypothetical protein